MPTVIPISELQRNIASITAECKETKKPIYLTKNGTSSLVIMDAETFDSEMAVHNEVLDREERVYRSIMRGIEDELAGRVRPFSQAREDAARLRSTQHAS